MKLFPIIKIIQIHRILRSRDVIGQVIGAEDRFPRAIIVIVSADRGVKLFDRRFVQLGGIFFDPRLELAIRWLTLLNVIDHGITIEPQAVDYHLVVAFAGTGITGGKLAAALERKFQPKAGQMQHA